MDFMAPRVSVVFGISPPPPKFPLVFGGSSWLFDHFFRILNLPPPLVFGGSSWLFDHFLGSLIYPPPCFWGLAEKGGG